MSGFLSNVYIHEHNSQMGIKQNALNPKKTPDSLIMLDNSEDYLLIKWFLIKLLAPQQHRRRVWVRRDPKAHPGPTPSR